MDLAKDALITKRKVLESFTQENLYPYTKYYLSDVFARTGKYWINHFSTIGIIGMNEACLNLMDKDISTKEGKNFSIRVLNFMRDRIMQYQEETGDLFNLEATPAEGVTYRFAKHDKRDFPDIITAGKNEPYYTNSVHLPVNYPTDIFDLLDHQEELQALFTGGTVVHCFLGERIDDPAMVKNLVRKIAENYTIPYFTITPTFSICPVHGYIPGSYDYCPHDHSKEDLQEHGIQVDNRDIEIERKLAV